MQVDEVRVYSIASLLLSSTSLSITTNFHFREDPVSREYYDDIDFNDIADKMFFDPEITALFIQCPG